MVVIVWIFLEWKNKRTNQLEFTDSFVDMYSNRFNSVKYQTTFEENDYNFMEFVRFFDSKRQNGELKLRSNPQKIAMETLSVLQESNS